MEIVENRMEGFGNRMERSGLVGNELQLEIVGVLADVSMKVLKQSKPEIESLITLMDRSYVAKHRLPN